MTNQLTWADVVKYVNENKTANCDYFSTGFKVKAADAVWTDDTWRIAVWVTEGGSEGFYLHVDRITSQSEERLPVALGKFWDAQRALEAANRLTAFIYGWSINTAN